MMVIMILRFRKIDRSVKLFKDCSTLEHIIDHWIRVFCVEERICARRNKRKEKSFN
jgi:hypothetical protein